jgi:hypothetical protein
MIPLEKPLKVKNVDRTLNKEGSITHQVVLTFFVGDQEQKYAMYVTGLGKWDFIFGMPWFKRENPIIDWSDRSIKWRNPTSITIEEDISLLSAFISGPKYVNHLWIHRTSLEDEEYEPPLLESDLKTRVPEAYHDYLPLFSKRAATRLPEKTPWDHTINLKEDFQPRSFPAYKLTPGEDKYLQEFIDENMKKGYIRKSKSPMASPMFFVAKKETTEKQPCQDYRYLNAWTVSDAYPLPLISDIMDRIQGNKYFTKLDI